MRINAQFRNDAKIENALVCFLYFCFFVFVFFPYVEIFNIGTDTQPYAFFMAALIFPFFKIRLTIPHFLLAFVLLWSLVALVIGGLSFLSLRSLYNYLALFLISYVTYKVLKTGRIDISLFIKFVAFVWICVGFLQSVFDKELFNFLVSSARTTESRGVVGLAPEPTFYGVVLLFLMLFLFGLNEKGVGKYIFGCVVGIVFFAKSTMVVLFLIIMGFIWLVLSAKVKYIIMLLPASLLYPFFLNYMEGTRLGFILTKVASDPASIILLDASANDRFFHVFFSIKGMIDNFFIPNGYSAWVPYVERQIPQFSDVVIVEWFSMGGRIMSGFGAGFYELGVMFALVPIALTYSFYKLYFNDIKKFLFFTTFVNVIMFSAIPVGLPLFPFYIGFINFLAFKKRQLNV
ncbi:hypothetical protein [Marinobacter shengliensis]